jgi:hypothetical protein
MFRAAGKNKPDQLQAENERLARDLATYRHAFETTAADRDRWKHLASVPAHAGAAPPHHDIAGATDTSSTPALPPIDLAKQHNLMRQLQQRQTADHYFFVDVVGSCNLKCPSCAVGNTAPFLAKGLMSPETFSEILARIKTEYPEYQRIFIDLYNWGEPGIHPKLSTLVKLAKDANFGVGISSNLNAFPDMREVVKAGPDYLRISLSGMQPATYETTHKGGNIYAVKSNMYRLRELLDRYQSPTIVQVGFHVYRTNFPGDFLTTRSLCDELGFIFAPVLATVMPVERVMRIAEGRETSEIGPVADKFVLSSADLLALFKGIGAPARDCQFRKARTTINFDGSVSLCCATFEPDSLIASDFRTTSKSQIEKSKYDHPLCGPCMEHQVNKIFTGMHTPERNEEAVAVLGPIYRSYLEETRNLGQTGYVAIDGMLLNVEHVYALGMAALSRGKAGWEQARRYFDVLVSGSPEFGEGFYQSAALAEREGNLSLAMQHAREAVRQLPDNSNYAALLQRLEQATQSTGLPD